MIALQNTLQMKEATISFLDAQIEAAKENLDQLAIPYFDLRARFESAQSAYLAAKENHEDLLNQRTQLDQSMQHLNALLHPLRRFPADILVKIFMFAVETEMERDYDRVEMPRFKKPQAIINITRVCSKWRTAAYAKPELWTYVRLNLSRRSLVHEKLQHFLAYSDGLPMNVSTSNLQPGFFGTSTDSEDDENGPSALPLLIPIKKLRSLTVNYTHYRALQYLPALGTACLDSLEELHLRSEPLSSPASGLFSIASYLSEAPNLRILRLMHVHLLPPAAHEPAPNLQLPKVQELVMHGPMTHGTDIFGFAQVVAMLPNVEKITFCQNDTVPFVLTDDIQLPRLRELVTNCVALDNALRTSFGADRIISPKLEKLYVIDAMNLAGGSTNFNGGLPAPAVLGGNLTSGLTLFLEKVRSIRDLTLVGNFDPFSNGSVSNNQPLLQLPAFGAFMPPVVPVPAQPFIMNNGVPMNPLPVPATNTFGGNGGNGLPLLRAMKDIERMEVLTIHPKFAEALYTTRLEADGEVSEGESPEEIAVDESEETTPSAQASASTSTAAETEEKRGKPMKLHTTFSYLPNLRRLEFTVGKSNPLTRQDFYKIFNARCWVDKKGKASIRGGNAEDDEEDDVTPRGPEMRSLDKLEVHLGAGLEDDLTDAVSEKMILEGEEKGCRWFSWTHP